LPKLSNYNQEAIEAAVWGMQIHETSYRAVCKEMWHSMDESTFEDESLSQVNLWSIICASK
jgi:hypothetical protein